MKTLLHTAAIVTALLSAPAWAQTAAVKVEGAWARASVQGQKATGAFMRLTAKDGARLVRGRVNSGAHRCRRADNPLGDARRNGGHPDGARWRSPARVAGGAGAGL